MDAALPAGTHIEGYRIESVLGRGGMGVVYEATQLSLQRVVALKMLAAELGSDAAVQERFRREALMQSTLDHPHVVQVYDAGSTAAGLFIAMRLIRGETLKSRISGARLTAGEVLSLLRPIADALDAAHAAGLIHRDVKSQNILVDARGRAYLTDFGIANAIGQTSLTLEGRLLGTPAYMAPEQAMGEEATPASDVYSLATVLYECLTGVVPFRAPTPVAVVRQQVHQPPPRASEIRAELPRQVDEVFGRALAKSQTARPKSAGELMDAVAKALALPGELATTRTSVVRQAPKAATLARRRRRPGMRAWFVALVSVVGASALVAFATAGHGGTGDTDHGATASVVLGRPTVTLMTRGEFLKERNIPVKGIARLVLRQQGAALESNLRLRGYPRRLPVTCAIRDLTAERTIGDVRTLTTEGDDALTATTPCWIPLTTQNGHRYRATVRVWPSENAGAPLATAVRDFEHTP